MKNKMIGNVTYAIIDDVQDIFKLFIYKRVKLSCYTPCRRLGGGCLRNFGLLSTTDKAICRSGCYCVASFKS